MKPEPKHGITISGAIITGLLAISTLLHAETRTYEGSISIPQPAQVGGILVRSAEAVYRLTINFDPFISGKYKYEADSKLAPLTKVWLICQTPTSPRYYVMLDPTVPNPGKGYGYNATRAPNWEQTFKRSPRSEGNDYLDATGAKQFWESGFTVVGMMFEAGTDTTAKARPSDRAATSGSSRNTTGVDVAAPGKSPSQATGGASAAQAAAAALEATQAQRKEEEAHRQQAATQQRQQELEQQQRQAQAESERRQQEARERLETLQQQNADAQRRREEAAERLRNEQEEKRAESKRKADAIAAEVARANREMSDTIDRGVNNINNVFDQIHRANAESRQNERRMEAERREREEAEESFNEAKTENERLARQEAESRHRYEEEMEELRQEEESARRDAIAERARAEEAREQEAADQAKAKQRRIEAKEKRLKSDAAAALSGVSKRKAIPMTNGVFDHLDTLLVIAQTNKSATNIVIQGSALTNGSNVVKIPSPK